MAKPKLYQETGTLCPKCKTGLKTAPGIGQYCPNTKCDVLDGVDLYNEDGEQIHPSPVILHKIHPEALRATVLIGDGADIVMITYDASSPIWPFEENTLSTKFEAAKGQGVEYVRKTFGMEPEVIET